MADEGLHEIQLNGKQLVFMFMAATVVAVVIFLCGVMVGRGVQVQQAVDASTAPVETPFDPTAVPEPTAPATTSGSPLTAQETLTYAERLEDSKPAVETLKPEVAAASLPPAPAERVEPPAPAPVPVAAAPAASTSATPAARALSEPPGNGWVVQVAAVRERAEAEVIARRLSTKGYPAFITTPANAARVFRVRVGKYPERREAETVSNRLEKEEQFKPWITR